MAELSFSKGIKEGLMADRVLRDHSQPCEHVGYGAEETQPGMWTCFTGDCPGGREVVLSTSGGDEDVSS